jgi:hypothetical protein
MRRAACILALLTGCASEVVGRGSDVLDAFAPLDAPRDRTVLDVRDAFDATVDSEALDATADANDAGTPHCTPPRPIAPLSTSWVSTRSPTLRWERGEVASATHVEFCRDRECTGERRVMDSSDRSLRLESVEAGNAFWRVFRTCADGTESAGPWWQFHVPRRAPTVDTSWGTVPDVDNDGYPELLVASSRVELGRIYRGSRDGIDAMRVWHVPIANAYRPSFMSAGDVNGDGYGDVLGYEGGAPPGVVRVFYGNPSGLSFTRSSALDGTAGSQFGLSMIALGDVDADGYGDVLVGEPVASRLPGINGAWFFRGGASGVVTPGVAIHSSNSVRFADTVAAAGDTDGDGFGDALIGQPTTSSALLYRGDAGGLLDVADVTLTGGPTSSFGYSMALAGDLDSDGYSDVAIGTSSFGSVRLFHGGSSGLQARETTILPGSGNSYGYAIAMAGDVDGDGFDDVIASGAGGSDSSDGSVYVIFGAAVTTSMQGVRIAVPMDARGFGWSVIGGADYDGDGLDDVAVGALGADRTFVYRGSAARTFDAPWRVLDGGEL